MDGIWILHELVQSVIDVLKKFGKMQNRIEKNARLSCATNGSGDDPGRVGFSL